MTKKKKISKEEGKENINDANVLFHSKDMLREGLSVIQNKTTDMYKLNPLSAACTLENPLMVASSNIPYFSPTLNEISSDYIEKHKDQNNSISWIRQYGVSLSLLSPYLGSLGNSENSVKLATIPNNLYGTLNGVASSYFEKYKDQINSINGIGSCGTSLFIDALKVGNYGTLNAETKEIGGILASSLFPSGLLNTKAQSVSAIYEGRSINLSEHIEKANLFTGANISVGISDFSIAKIPQREPTYTADTTTTKVVELGVAQMKITQEIQFQIGEVKDQVDELKRIMIADNTHKDEMLEEMMVYIKTNGAFIVPIKKIIFKKSTCELLVDRHSIAIKPDTNQFYLCNALCADRKKLKEGWEIMDLAEKMGADIESIDDKDEIKKMQERIYATLRHLNDKIKGEAGLESFFLYSSKTIMLNPKYSKKLK